MRPKRKRPVTPLPLTAGAPRKQSLLSPIFSPLCHFWVSGAPWRFVYPRHRTGDQPAPMPTAKKKNGVAGRGSRNCTAPPTQRGVGRMGRGGHRITMSTARERDWTAMATTRKPALHGPRGGSSRRILRFPKPGRRIRERSRTRGRNGSSRLLAEAAVGWPQLTLICQKTEEEAYDPR